MLEAARLRLKTRGREATEAEVKEMKDLQSRVSEASERMETAAAGGQWSQDDYAAMDFIVGELIRTRTP